MEWIAEDASGTIWLKTPVNYCFYNRLLDRMENSIASRLDSLGLQQKPDFLAVDHDGRLWTIGSHQASVHDFKAGGSRHFRTGRKSQVRAFAARGSDVWVLWTDGALQVLGRGDNAFHTVDSVPGLSVGTGMTVDSGRSLWLFDEAKTMLRKYSGNSHKAESDPASDIIYSRGMNVTSIAEDHRGDLWIGTDNSGLLRIGAGGVTHITSQPALPFSLPGNHIKCLFVDDNDVLWIGSSKNGVAFVALDAPAFDNILRARSPISVKSGVVYFKMD